MGVNGISGTDYTLYGTIPLVLVALLPKLAPKLPHRGSRRVVTEAATLEKPCQPAPKVAVLQTGQPSRPRSCRGKS